MFISKNFYLVIFLSFFFLLFSFLVCFVHYDKYTETHKSTVTCILRLFAIFFSCFVFCSGRDEMHFYRFLGQKIKVFKQRARSVGRPKSNRLSNRCHCDFMLTSLRLRARASCLVLVYSNQRTLGIRVVSLNRRNSEILHDTIRGNNGVKTIYVNANQNVANRAPITAPHNTCQTV